MAQKRSRSSTSSSRTSRSSSKGGKSGAGKPRDGKSGAAGKSGAGKGGGAKGGRATGGPSARKRAATGRGAGSRSGGGLGSGGDSGRGGTSGGGAPGRGWLPFDGRVLRILAVAVSITFVVGAVVGLLIGLNAAGSGAGEAVTQEDSAGDGRRASEADEGREPSERYPEGEDADTVAAGGDQRGTGVRGLPGGRAAEDAEPGGDKPLDGEKPPRGDRPLAGEKEPPPDKPIPLYVVIDDVGNSLEQLDAFLELGVPITYAVLPQRPHSTEAARRIARAGHEIILHQPMEAENGMDPGAGAILTSFDGTEIEKRLAENLQSLPGVIGVNNHMGSKVTADEKTMDTVLRYLGGKDLFFLDSRTTARTVGKAIAEKHSVSFAERHVFLDNEPNRDYIRQAVEQGMDVARQRGHAVLIGHVMVTEVAEVLEEMYPFIRDEGFDLHHLSDLVLGPQDDDLWD